MPAPTAATWLLLPAFTDSSSVHRALEEGAAGFLTRDSRRCDVVDAVRAVAPGQSVVPPELTGGLTDEIRMRRSESAPALSEREHQVLDGTARAWAFRGSPRSSASARARSRPTPSVSTRN
ncbi:hypothetical protein [Streptomyces tropicalis]|uniref:Response regulatory domain-containing protein n=1 Tax=Streptomyces tropicalis TaxID=3034234 RepID=A0ABT6A2G7_9ACTN|nr:hypothetical protein [Streptomyces tropicalis]MDF3298841.1 hypothetical protein [Streptomyces tropicalis]